MTEREPQPTGPPAPGGGPRAGIPAWALTAGGVLVLIAVVALVVALTRGGDGDTPDDRGPSVTTAAATEPSTVTDRLDPLPTAEDYAAAIAPAMARLDASAAATGAALAGAANPGGIGRVRTTATRQQQVVAQARARLAAMGAPASVGQAQAHGALAEATATHILYLRQVAQATGGTPTRARLDILAKARTTASRALSEYRRFYSLAPGVPDRITGSGLGNTAPTRGAMLSVIEAAERAAATPEGRGDIIPDDGFRSPTGNLRCDYRGSELLCSSLNDNFAVVLPETGGPVTASGSADGGPVLPYGSSWSRGAFTCSSQTNGISCENASGNGFFLSRESYFAW
ncbi:MAG: hypothetical protein ACLGG9_01980 [Thermoleophilia bacterium]|jgi:hypothetical protein